MDYLGAEQIVDRPDELAVRTGEVVAGQTAAAIGNAFAVATGIRLRICL